MVKDTFINFCRTHSDTSEFFVLGYSFNTCQSLALKTCNCIWILNFVGGFIGDSAIATMQHSSVRKIWQSTH